MKMQTRRCGPAPQPCSALAAVAAWDDQRRHLWQVVQGGKAGGSGGTDSHQALQDEVQRLKHATALAAKQLTAATVRQG